MASYPSSWNQLSRARIDKLFPKAGLLYPKFYKIKTGSRILPMDGNLARANHVMIAIKAYHNASKPEPNDDKICRADVDKLFARLINEAESHVHRLYEEHLLFFFDHVRDSAEWPGDTDEKTALSKTNLTLLLFELIRARADWVAENPAVAAGPANPKLDVSQTALAADSFLAKIETGLEGWLMCVSKKMPNGERLMLLNTFMARIFQSDIGPALNRWRVAEAEVMADGVSHLVLDSDDEEEPGKQKAGEEDTEMTGMEDVNAGMEEVNAENVGEEVEEGDFNKKDGVMMQWLI